MAGLVLASLFAGQSAPMARHLEKLDRGVVAVRTGAHEAFISWRLLGTDPSGLAFNVYRGATKLNAAPLTGATNFTDKAATAEAYSVRPVLNNAEQPAPASTPAWAQPYLRIPLQQPAGGTTVDGGTYTYTANDASAADLDGDGQYELVLKWDPSNSRDNGSAGVTGPVLLDAYRLDGTRLWRIDLGKNIRAGAHYTQFLVYYFDGDGRAELACKTADGTVDGAGKTLGDASKDYRSLLTPTDAPAVPNTRDARYGRILAGPEYFTVFDGRTGAALASAPYVPGRDPIDGWGG
ncbi:MAG: rhamnogalacturonan lyase, partial [Cytophagaceae bacterium]